MMALRKPKEETTSLKTAADAVKTYTQRVLKEGNQSAAHNFGHLSRVATYASLIVKAVGGSESEQELARIGGYLHDLVRSPTQTIDDETLSAQKAEPVLRGMKKFTEEDIHTILASIHSDTMPKRLLVSEEKDNVSNFKGEKLVCLAVGLADRIEANGAYVIARRSQFVGGERFLKGDLSDLKHRLESEGHPFAKEFDSTMAILCESYIRLGLKNNQSLYPKWFLPVVNELFNEQKSFYYSLLASKGLIEENLARILIDIKFPSVKASDIEGWEKRRPNSKEEIKAVTKEQMNAAVEVANFFSSPEMVDMDTAGAINKFKTTNPIAREWHKEMLDYLHGGLVKLMDQLNVSQ